MKYLRWTMIVLALALALGMLSAMFGALGSVDAAIVGPRVPWLAFLDIEDLEASTWYNLVDLDDKANFPHHVTSTIVLKQIQYTGVLSDATHWDIKFGVVITVGDVTSLVDWFYISHRVRATHFDEKWTLPEHGLSLMVNTTDEDLWNVATVEYTSTAAITTTTVLGSPVAASTTAEVGDLVLYVEEIDAGGHLDLSIGVSYDTD